jgi:transcriptional regulator with GAF, ATPase, and Fis domain
VAKRKSDDTTRLTSELTGPERWVLLVAGDGRLRRIPLPDRGSVVIGRDESCEVVLADVAISKRHARLQIADGNGVLVDLQSKNGTLVAGRKIAEPTKLAAGDVFEVGPITLVLNRVKDGAKPEEGAAAPIVADPTMKALLALVEQIAPSDLSVLILGETGSGKEVLASALHARSHRSRAALVRLNCAALPVSLLESELFGHEPGAFTGAIGSKKGLVDEADGGTLFLDEIGELPLEAQAKVLRAIEDGAFYRVGGRRAVKVDVRFVAATNRDLATAVQEGSFRADLFYRLNGIALRIPPLRERPTEIPLLAARFAEEAARALGLEGAPLIALDTSEALTAHPWPGNVRELKNTMQRAVLLSRGGPLRPEHLMLADAPPASVSAATRATVPAPAPGPPPSDGGGLRAEMQAIERNRIQAALDACAGNQTRAASMLGISRRTLISRLEIFGIARPTKG